MSVDPAGSSPRLSYVSSSVSHLVSGENMSDGRYRYTTYGQFNELYTGILYIIFGLATLGGCVEWNGLTTNRPPRKPKHQTPAPNAPNSPETRCVSQRSKRFNTH